MPSPDPTAVTTLSDAQRFSLLVASVKDYAIYMLDRTGHVSSWNPGAQRFKGYEAHEILGSHFSAFYPEEERAAGVPERALQTAANEGKFEAEGWRMRKDGTRFWAHVVIDPIRDGNGDLIGFAKITRDITDKKQTAEALEQMRAALFQSQKMEAIGKLTGGVAHDFNNLLAVLSNGLDVLSLRLQSHADIKLLSTMRRAVERGATLTQQLLSFARQQPLKMERCDLNALVRGFEGVLQRAVDASVEFEMRLAPRLRAVLVDAARFEASLLNLVVNARDAMPDGGKLVISTENVDLARGEIGHLAPGPYVKVSVTDSGTGMAPEVMQRAFEPFFTTKEVGKGTGLGLSQVYGFITQSGGEVQVRSEPGLGTTVSMLLPAGEHATEGDGSTRHEEHNPPPVDTVLVVDDEPDLLDVAGELFRSLGYEVLTAADAAQALRILGQRNDIGILFSDVVMPGGMSGIELARQARARRPVLRVLLASGYPLAALQAAHSDLAEFELMSKPYRMGDLVARLRNLH